MSGWDEANEAATVIHDALEREAWRCEVTGDDEDLTKMADLALDALAAAGYTVTKDRYESVSSDEAERFVAEAIHDYIADPEANWDDWLPEAHTAISGLLDRGVELYRKIERSTDG